MKIVGTRHRLSSGLILVALLLPSVLLSVRIKETEAEVFTSTPFAPHEIKVLVVGPSSANYHGKGFILSDLARIGFNITWHSSDTGTNYLTDNKTSDLSQYEVVILYSTTAAYQPSRVREEEVEHFTDFDGILIAIGNSLFANETSGTWWTNLFANSPITHYLEPRLGVDFQDNIKSLGGTTQYQNNGTFTKVSELIPSLPSYLNYADLRSDTGIQFKVATTSATVLYNFTAQSGKTTVGITYYKNSSTGAVGIYINGLYLYATEQNLVPVYRGFKNITQRTSFLCKIIAYALGKDFETIIKPQPLAAIRLDWLGGWGWDEAYLNASLFNFNSLVRAYGIMPTIAFTDSPDFNPQYWQRAVPNILSQLKVRYRDWEYSSSMRNKNITSMTQSEIESLIQDIEEKYAALEMDLFSTISTRAGYWDHKTLNAMSSQNLYFLDMAGEPEEWSLGKHYPDWWNLRIVSGVIVHSGVQMSLGWNFENFTQIDSDTNVAKNMLHYEYFRDRDKWALAVVHGFPCFVYNVWHFRRNEVGTYSLQRVYEKLTSEILDIRFVPIVEAALYFGNKWASIKNPTRVGSTVEFDVDSSAVPEVVNVGKGMVWLRIDANETIKEVFVDNKPWHYFDDHSLRLPADSVHVRVTLGSPTTPRVVRTAYMVVDTAWDMYRFVVSFSAKPGVNVSAQLLIPEIGAFVGDQWNTFCSATQWNCKFDAISRTLKFWAISNGTITFRAGPDVMPPVFWEIDNSPTWYNTSVTVTAYVTDLQTGMGNVTLSYLVADEWVNITMIEEEWLYVATIPAFPYGTSVRYKLYASDNIGNWRVTEIFGYNVTDETPPEIGEPDWGPLNPSAGQPVFVRVSVSETESASDLQKVFLWYFLDRNLMGAKSVEMMQENGGIWWTEIPGQGGGKLVSFFVLAYDNAGNVGKTLDYSYTVTGNETLDLPLPILVAVVSIAAVSVGIVVYLKKFKKSKHKG
jgi:hypothetical protein